MLHLDYQYDARVIPAALDVLGLGICDVVLGNAFGLAARRNTRAWRWRSIGRRNRDPAAGSLCVHRLRESPRRPGPDFAAHQTRRFVAGGFALEVSPNQSVRAMRVEKPVRRPYPT